MICWLLKIACLVAVIDVVLVGCALAVRAEGCELLLIELEGIREADALPVKPP